MSGMGSVNVTCNSNCTKWCPRVFKCFCCCLGKSGGREETREKVDGVAQAAITHTGKPKDEDGRIHVHYTRTDITFDKD